MYGEDYKTDFQKQVNGLNQNITKVREIISPLFFHTDGGFKVADSLENAITLVDNAALIAMPHFDEIYLALARTSNRYDDDYECIKGDEQSFNILKDKELSIVFSFDYYLFVEQGKVYVDGKEVSSDNYKLSKGSTVVTLSDTYLKTLGEGTHTIALKMDDKEADASFNVTSIADPTPESEDSINPKTGDNIMAYFCLFGISISGLIVILVRKKYRDSTSKN